MDEKLDKDEQACMDFVAKEYPEHKAYKSVDEGDVLIYYLRYSGEALNNFGKLDLVLYYNTWYPGMFEVRKLAYLED